MAIEWASRFTASVSNPLSLLPVFNEVLFPMGE